MTNERRGECWVRGKGSNGRMEWGAKGTSCTYYNSYISQALERQGLYVVVAF
jgi:hypothetical protein